MKQLFIDLTIAFAQGYRTFKARRSEHQMLSMARSIRHRDTRDQAHLVESVRTNNPYFPRETRMKHKRLKRDGQ